MAQQIGKVLQNLIKSEQWDNRLNQIKLKENWEEIMGKTIAKYTYDIYLQKGILYISTDLAPLKNELHIGKEQIINNINSFFKSIIVKKVVIK